MTNWGRNSEYDDNVTSMAYCWVRQITDGWPKSVRLTIRNSDQGTIIV